MNKLVLIGNGFDLAHGLKTSYSDFILWYLNKCFSEVHKNNNSYEDDLLNITCNQIIPNKIFYTLKEYKEFIRGYDVIVKFKNEFLGNIIEKNYNYNWVDIESEYYYLLVDNFNHIEKTPSNKTYLSEIEMKNLNICFELVKDKLREYLIQNIRVFPHDKIEEISFHFINLISDKSDKLYGNSMLVLNFNYTDTLDLYLDNNSNSYKINYIHGKLTDIDNPIIFGYGDEMDTNYEKIERLNENEFLKNIKSFGYFKTRNYKNFSLFIDSSLFEVHIMGHSCGLSDRILLNSIFEHDNCKKIQIYYHQTGEDKYDNDHFEKTQEISRHFKAENKGEMRKLIVPFPECEPLTKYKPT